MFNIIDLGAETSPFDCDGLPMKLRDTFAEQVRRFGACDDDYEAVCSVEGDFREEDSEAFLSRPLRLNERVRLEDDEVERQFQSLLRNGW